MTTRHPAGALSVLLLVALPALAAAAPSTRSVPPKGATSRPAPAVRGTLDQNTYMRLRQAQARLAGGQTQEGLAALKQLADERPDSPELLQAYVDALLNMGSYAASVDYLEARLAVAGDAWPVRGLLARAQFLGGRKADADATWSAMLSSRASDEGAYREVGSQRLALGDAGGAEATYVAGRKALGNADAFALELEAVHKAAGRIDAAMNDCLALLRRPGPTDAWVAEELLSLLKVAQTPGSGASRANQTVGALDALAAENPDRDDLRRLALRAFLQNGRQQQAIQRAGRWDQNAAAAPAVRRDAGEARPTSALLALARLAEDSGDTATACAASRAALATKGLAPDDLLEARLFLARAAEGAGRLEEALGHYQAIVTADGAAGSAPARDAPLRVADLERRLGRPADAIALYERLLAHPATGGPPAEEVRVALAECYLALGRTSDARAAFDAVVQSPAARPLRERAAFGAAEASFAAGDFQDAAQRYRVVADLFPDGGLVNDALSRILLIAEGESDGPSLVRFAAAERADRGGRSDSAAYAFTALIAAAPQSPLAPAAGLRLGQIALRSGHVSEALARFAAIANSLPDSRVAPEALKAQADVYADQIGDEQRALDLYTRFLEKYPANVFSSEVRLRAERIRRGAVKGF